MNKKRKGQALVLMLVSILAVSHLQAVDASTVNKAKNKKEQAEQELNQTKKQIEAIEKQQSTLRSEIDEKDAELVNLLVNIGILEEELDAKNVQLAQVTEELAQAQQKSADQYEAMKKRIQFMYGGRLQKVKFKYSGLDIDAVLDRLPTAQILDEEEGIYTISAEVFGKGIDMWLRGQGEAVEVI